MAEESNWDVEIVQVEIPRDEYDAMLVQLVKALLALLEKPIPQVEDHSAVNERKAA